MKEDQFSIKSSLRVQLQFTPVVTYNKLHHAIIERFSIECHKTKAKVIILANQKGHRQYSEPVKTWCISLPRQQREMTKLCVVWRT